MRRSELIALTVQGVRKFFEVTETECDESNRN